MIDERIIELINNGNICITKKEYLNILDKRDNTANYKYNMINSSKKYMNKKVIKEFQTESYLALSLTGDLKLDKGINLFYVLLLQYALDKEYIIDKSLFIKLINNYISAGIGNTKILTAINEWLNNQIDFPPIRLFILICITNIVLFDKDLNKGFNLNPQYFYDEANKHFIKKEHKFKNNFARHHSYYNAFFKYLLRQITLMQNMLIRNDNGNNY